MNQPIRKYKARDVWRRHGSGWDARLYFWAYGLGEVKVFTHDGLSQRTEAFTLIETVVGDQHYSQRFDRCYHKRWLWRLANMFACRVKDHHHIGRPLNPDEEASP